MQVCSDLDEIVGEVTGNGTNVAFFLSELFGDDKDEVLDFFGGVFFFLGVSSSSEVESESLDELELE